MKVVYKARAKNAIVKVAIFVESQNTSGSGELWFEKLDDFIHAFANSKAKFQICKDPSLASYRYHCFVYKNWIIAFKFNEHSFEVCRFILGKRLNY